MCNNNLNIKPNGVYAYYSEEKDSYSVYTFHNTTVLYETRMEEVQGTFTLIGSILEIKWETLSCPTFLIYNASKNEIINTEGNVFELIA